MGNLAGRRRPTDLARGWTGTVLRRARQHHHGGRRARGAGDDRVRHTATVVPGSDRSSPCAATELDLGCGSRWQAVPHHPRQGRPGAADARDELASRPETASELEIHTDPDLHLTRVARGGRTAERGVAHHAVECRPVTLIRDIEDIGKQLNPSPSYEDGFREARVNLPGGSAPS